MHNPANRLPDLADCRLSRYSEKRRPTTRQTSAEELMSTAAPPHRPAPAMLYDIDWHTYTRLLRAFESRRGYRLTYDRGTLEIMSPLREHEQPAYLLGRCIDVLTEELNLPCQA